MVGDEASMGAIAIHATIDDHAAAAVRKRHIASAVGNDTASIHLGSVDSTGGTEVLDGGIIDVAERGHILSGALATAGALVEGQRVALAVEGAVELMVARTHHAVDGNVSIKLHGLATEVVTVITIVHGIAEETPAYSVFNGINITFLYKAIRVGSEGDSDVDDVYSRGNVHCGSFGIHVVAGSHLDIAAVLEDYTLDEILVRRVGRYDERRAFSGSKDFRLGVVVSVGVKFHAGFEGDVVLVVNAVGRVGRP